MALPLLWFPDAIAVYLVGLLLTATVIAAPIGLGLMEFGKFLFAPFGRAMVSKKRTGDRAGTRLGKRIQLL